jgi:tetratricopeptide (TPR) repeat protein
MNQHNDAIKGVVGRFINTSDWDEKLKILEQELSLLLTDEADDLLISQIAALADSSDPQEERRKHYLGVHLAALRMLQDADPEDAWGQVEGLFFNAEGVFDPDAEATTSALGAFLAANTWGEKHDILERHQTLLLKNSVDRDLSGMAKIYAQTEGLWAEAWYHHLHLLLLRFARARGIDSIWDGYELVDEAEKSQSTSAIAKALLAYLLASTWQEKFNLLEGEKELLVTAAGITFLEVIIFNLVNSGDLQDKNRKHYLEVHLVALRILHSADPDNAWKQVEELFFNTEGVFDPDAEATMKALRAFIVVDTWGEKHDILEHHQTLLLKDSVEGDLSDMIKRYTQQKDLDEQYYHYLHLLLLRFARARGADTIWTGYELIGEAEKHQSTRAIAKALFAYTLAPTWREKFNILEREGELLITAAGISFLAVTIFNMEVPQSGDQAIYLLYSYMQLDLLVGARISGLTTAWTAFQKVYAEQLRHLPDQDAPFPVLQGDIDIAANVLSEFLAAPWDEREALLEQNATVLLGDTVNAMLLIQMKKLEKSSDPQDQLRLAVVASHRALLLRAREIGIPAACAEFSSGIRQGEQQEVMEAISVLIQAKTVNDVIEILEAPENLLLTESTDHILADLIEEAESGDASMQEAFIHDLKACRTLFRRTHEVGVPVAYIEFKNEMNQYTQEKTNKQKTVKGIIYSCMQAETEDAAITILEEQAALLLAESTDQMLTGFIEEVEAENDPSKDETQYALTQLRTLFRRAREIGVATAYQELDQEEHSKRHIPSSLRLIRDEISHITQLQDFPRRIALLQEAIERVEAGEGDQILAGRLQYELGAVLSQNPVGNPQQNQELAIVALEKALQVFTREASPGEWANIQNVLGIIYRDRTVGKKAENLERAIAYFEASLEVTTREVFPREWSIAQSNLGVAYGERIWGDRSENWERAIAYAETALQVLTYEAFPYDWARTQVNLGVAYHDRFLGEKAENLEQAIECYERSLQIFTLENYPFEWARTQMNMAMAYTNRIQSDRAENQERALVCCKEALRIYTRETIPMQWATTQFNLGVVYSHRVHGDISDNLEQALQCYLAALQVFTHQDFPVKWAETQFNLGSVYTHRTHNDAGDNLEQAITGYKAALEVLTHDDYPIEWAETHMNMGVAFAHRIRGDKSENIEQAIFHLQKATQVFIPSAFPERFHSLVLNLGTMLMRRREGNKSENMEQAKIYLEASSAFYTPDSNPDGWAASQVALATLYQGRLLGDKSENMEQAMYHAELALQIRTRESYPREWAMIQHNLGAIYADRIQGDKIANLERARLHLEQALQVRKRDTLPTEYRDTMIALGELFLNEIVSEGKRRNDTEFVKDAYHRAHLAYLEARQVQAELGWLIADEMGRVSLQGKRHDISEMYRRDMWCLLQLGDLKNAAVALEAGRMQALAESLAISGVRFDDACVGHALVFTSARKALLEARVRGDRSTMRKTREQFLQVREAIRAHCRPDFLPSEPSYEDIAQAAAPDQALIYLDGTAYGGVALVIPPAHNNPDGSNRSPFAIQLPLLTTDAIKSWYVRRDAAGHWTGGYYFVLYHAATALLSYWIEYGENEEEQLSRKMMPVGDVADALPLSMSTVKAAMKEMVAAWNTNTVSYHYNSQLQQKNEEKSLHERLSMPLGEALSHNILTNELNWFLHQTELSQLLVDMQVTFASELRDKLDQHNLGDPDQSIALIPCGRLGILPVHAAWVRNDPSSGNGSPFFETCELSFQPAARVFAMARQTCRSLPQQGPFIAVGNPQPTTSAKLGWAEAEAKVVASLAQIAGRAGSKSIIGQSATLPHILKILESTRREYTGAWIHIASHGFADATNPSNSFMLLAEDKRFTLADLQRRRLLEGCRGFIASGCVTGLGDFETAPDELGSFAMGVLQAGSPCAIATLWSVSDDATFLIMSRLVYYLLEDPAISPAKALREAVRWLRHATPEQLGEPLLPGLTEFRAHEADNESEYSGDLRSILSSHEESTDHITAPQVSASLKHTNTLSNSTTVPYAHPFYWAATVMYGV